MMPTKPTKGPNFRWNGRVPNPVPKEKKVQTISNEIEGIALPTPILKLGLFCILMLLLVFLLSYSIINFIQLPYQKAY